MKLDIAQFNEINRNYEKVIIRNKLARKEYLAGLKREVMGEIAPKIDNTQDERRERIPEKMRMYVWQRDGGKCARCGSRENLEYDHIIPVSKGGSNTERNIELLCEKCNRSKSDNVS